MNWIQFGRLIYSIYRRGGAVPDVEWIQSLGLLAVKLGQVHALRIDFLDEEKCEQLAQLYRRTIAIAPSDFTELLAASAGSDFFDHFRSIDKSALASASVGQVHRADLRNGDEVVIKAIKADVRETFVKDVASLKRLFRLAIRVYRPLQRVGDPIGILEDIEDYTLSELDLQNEIAGQQALSSVRDSWSGTFDLSTLKFPLVYASLSSGNILVSEYVAGPTIDELLESGEMRYEQLLELFRLHGFCMLCVGTFHGDLHPGNVLIKDDDFYFIDTGYIGVASEALRNGLFSFFAALCWYDYAGCADALNAMSTRKLEGAAFERFRRGLLKLYANFEGATVSEVSLTKKMMQTIKFAVRAGMAFEREIFGIIRSLMYLDGMVLRCNPDAVLMRDMRGAIDEFLRVR